MVPHPRTAHGLGRIRTLNGPRPLNVQTGGAGAPVAVQAGRAGKGRAPWHKVEHVLEVWRVDEEWWRPRPVHRLYYRVLLDNGAVTDIYQDLVDGHWYGQRYNRGQG